jgi:hypothetical protein
MYSAISFNNLNKMYNISPGRQLSKWHVYPRATVSPATELYLHTVRTSCDVDKTNVLGRETILPAPFHSPIPPTHCEAI